MSEIEPGNIAEMESRKMERNAAFSLDLEKLKTSNYSDDELRNKRSSLSELGEAV